MYYDIISVLSILVTAGLIYVVAPKLNVSIQLKSLVLCACCAVIISLLIPQIIVGIAGLVGTIVILLALAFVFAFFITFYDRFSHRQITRSSSPGCLLVSMGVNDFVKRELSVADSVYLVTESEEVEVSSNDTKIENEMEQEDINSRSLDELLNLAFGYKENNRYDLALSVFRRALDLYPHSESAPYLVAEIGNILKNKGRYDEAITVFTQGRSLPALKDNPLLQEEFVSMIAYLRITKNVLIQHQMSFCTWDKISQEILAEIESEFNEWRKIQVS